MKSVVSVKSLLVDDSTRYDTTRLLLLRHMRYSSHLIVAVVSFMPRHEERGALRTYFWLIP